MIEVMPESQGNVLIFKAVGKLTDKDYKDVLIPRLEEIIREHGKARLLFSLGRDFHGWEAAAMWDDAHFGVAHRNDFEKMAVVGGPFWVDWGFKLAPLFMSGEVKTFTENEYDAALQWIKT